MADKKISQLSTLPYVDLADGDSIVILDTSTGVTKRILVSELKLKWQAYTDTSVADALISANATSIINSLIFG